MRAIILVGMLLLAASGAGADETLSPREIVDARMEAYNDHDLASFLELYADDVEIFTYPDKALTVGKVGLRSIFEPMFKEGVVKVTIHSQIEKDSYVVNHETVDYGGEEIEYVSIYEVRGGLIRSVRFVRD